MQFDASIRDGALFPRWAMHHIQGYGYPTFIIQAPLGFYLAEFFVLLGFGYTLAAKLAWATGFLISAWGMYRLTLYWLTLYEQPQPARARDSSSPYRLAALIAGVMYVFVPYHLLDIYVRAALNDALLLAWFPWIFLAFDRLIDRGTQPGWQARLALAVLALAGVLLTHTFALLSFTPLLITFVLFRLWQRWRMADRLRRRRRRVVRTDRRTRAGAGRRRAGSHAYGRLPPAPTARRRPSGATGLCHRHLQLPQSLCLVRPVLQPLLGIRLFG